MTEPRTNAGRYWIAITKERTEPPDMVNLVAGVEAIVAQVEDEMAEREEPLRFAAKNAADGLAISSVMGNPVVIAAVDSLRAALRTGQRSPRNDALDVDRLAEAIRPEFREPGAGADPIPTTAQMAHAAAERIMARLHQRSPRNDEPEPDHAE